MVDLIGDAVADYALVTVGSRRISTIMPDVTIEETHRDELVITDHPVEVGSTITDHAFKRPAEVQMRIGFSDSKHQSIGYSKQAYEAMLAIQAGREPFEVSTGKRNYKDMLIGGISVTTDPKSEFALSAVISLRQIIITDTSGNIDTTGDGGLGLNQSGTATTSNPANMGNPSETQGATQGGLQQLTPVSPAGSALLGDFLPAGTSYGGFPTLGGPGAVG